MKVNDRVVKTLGMRKGKDGQIKRFETINDRDYAVVDYLTKRNGHVKYYEHVDRLEVYNPDDPVTHIHIPDCLVILANRDGSLVVYPIGDVDAEEVNVFADRLKAMAESKLRRESNKPPRRHSEV